MTAIFFFIEIENFRGEGKILMRHTHDPTFLEKKIRALCTTKKINILTLVLSEKKILNETKNHNPPPSKLNGRSLMVIRIVNGRNKR
jgi:hypothetical protein